MQRRHASFSGTCLLYTSFRALESTHQTVDLVFGHAQPRLWNCCKDQEVTTVGYPKVFRQETFFDRPVNPSSMVNTWTCQVLWSRFCIIEHQIFLQETTSEPTSITYQQPSWSITDHTESTTSLGRLLTFITGLGWNTEVHLLLTPVARGRFQCWSSPSHDNHEAFVEECNHQMHWPFII